MLLGTQLKAEGNCLYEAEHYSAAVELYSAAIHLGYAVLERRDTAMAQQRLSMFFSNRAACFIKMVFTAVALLLLHVDCTRYILIVLRIGFGLSLALGLLLLLSCAKSHMLSASRRQPHLFHVSTVDHSHIVRCR